MASASGRLGCASDVKAFVTQQCGGPKVCALESVADIRFNRILDDISEAQVTIPVAVGTAGGVNPCCGCMADIEPWCHELNIVREGDVVWQGPVVDVDYQRTQVIVTAKDVLAWTQKRVPQGTYGNATTPMELTDIAVDMLENAAFDEHDPCVLRYIFQTDLNNRPTYIGPISLGTDEFPAFEGSVFDWLGKLNELGLDFTTLGRRIVLGVDARDLPPAGTITDEHILGDISIKKDGDAMANRVFVRYDNDTDATVCQSNADAGLQANFIVPCPAEVEGDMFCYGPIERVISDNLALNFSTAVIVGQTYIDAGKIAPRVVEFPAGSRLSPSTPFDFNELVPGMLVRLAVSGLCLPVNQVFKLTEVTYSLGSDGNEEIAIALTTPNFPGATG